MVRYFHIDHNAPLFTPPPPPKKKKKKFCITIVSNFFAITVVPREMEDNGYVKFSGVKRCIVVCVKMVNSETALESGSLLCRIALWDCFKDISASFTTGNWVQIRPPK